MINQMTTNILWIDDEIDSLKAQFLFLEGKGYTVATASNGYDGLEYIKNNHVDVVLLDESMPGMTGLETLIEIKKISTLLPVVMVTKNEAENIMEDAIGSQITDYLIKPVNPNQVLLTLKKILDRKSLVSEKTTHNYQVDFRNLFMDLQDSPNHEEWKTLYKKIVYWELEIQKADSPEMMDVFSTQKAEANSDFCKFISKNYAKWIAGKDAPILSHQLMKEKVLPNLEKGKPLFFVLIDNLRYDHWKSIEPIIAESFRINDEDIFYSILPTSTQYARNAIFAGILPIDIEKKFPEQWRNDDDDGGKNNSEKEFFANQLKMWGKSDLKFSYTKITNHADGETMANNMLNLMHNDINIIVYNFVDMLSHARTEMEVLKELANDEVSYRSIATSWFLHSPLHEALKKISDKNVKVIIATDHGSVRVKNAEKVIGDKSTTANIRYKHGRNLNYDSKQILAFKDPAEVGLPRPNMNSSYIFALNDTYLCYPNNYNHYVKFFNNTFQHGGVSLEEILIPVVVMEGKGI
jgi:CheY-like chemotaxis protein